MNWPEDYIGKVLCGDCLEAMKGIPSDAIDLVVTDPPYDLDIHRGSGIGSRDSVKVYKKIIAGFGNGLDPTNFLDEIERCLNKFNAYCWCSKRQLVKYLTWLSERGLKFNVLTWHKNNPIPFTNNGYMSDTEYCIFIRRTWDVFHKWIGEKFLFTILDSTKTKRHPASDRETT